MIGPGISRIWTLPLSRVQKGAGTTRHIGTVVHLDFSTLWVDAPEVDKRMHVAYQVIDTVSGECRLPSII